MDQHDFIQWIIDNYKMDQSMIPVLNAKYNTDTAILSDFLLTIKANLIKATSEDGDRSEYINLITKAPSIFHETLLVKHARNYIVRLINKGNSCGAWNLPVPQVAIINIREPSPITPGEFKNYHDYIEHFQEFINAIKDNTALDLNSQIGMSIVSFCYFGGITKINVLQNLITNRKNYKHSGEYGWVDCYEDGNKKNNIVFRWQPDPVSEMLFVQYVSPETNIETTPLKLRIYINRFFNSVKTGLEIGSLTSFLNACQIAYHISVPAYIAHNFKNPYMITPLPTYVWRRYRGQKISQYRYIEKKEDFFINYDVMHNHKKVDLIRFDQNRLYNIWHKKVFQSSNELVKLKKPRQFIIDSTNFLDSYINEIAQPLLYAIQWINYLVETTLKISSARQYISLIKPVIFEFGAIDFSSTTDNILLDVYNSVLKTKKEKSTTEQAARVAGRIKSYQTFLYLFAQAPEIPFSDLLYANEGGHNVNANILSDNEIIEIQTLYLNANDLVNYLYFTLGVRLGLRISEAINLKIGDFVGVHDFNDGWVFIRSNEYHDIKSRSGIRKIQLKQFFSKDEYKIFSDYYKNRWLYLNRMHGNPKLVNNAFFINNDEQVSTAIIARRINDTLIKTIRQVTNDYFVTYHILRHTFINNNLLTELKKDNTSRDVLQSFSYLAGHLSPKTTLRSYFHLMHILDNYFLTQRLNTIVDISIPQLCSFFCYSDKRAIERVYKRCKHTDNRFSAVIQQYRKDFLDEFREKSDSVKKNRIKKIPVQPEKWMHPRLFYSCLYDDNNKDFLIKLSHINKRNEDFYLNVFNGRDRLVQAIDNLHANGISWPNPANEQKILLKTYRAIEKLTQKKLEKFRDLYKSNRHRTDLVFQTKNIKTVISYCKFLDEFGFSDNIYFMLTPSKARYSITDNQQAKNWLGRLNNFNRRYNKIFISGKRNSIQPVIYAGKKLCGKLSISVNSHNKASHGFKMGIVLALTYYHFQQASSMNPS